METTSLIVRLFYCTHCQGSTTELWTLAELQDGRPQDAIPQVHISIHVVSTTLIKIPANTTHQHISRRATWTLAHGSLYPQAKGLPAWPVGTNQAGKPGQPAMLKPTLICRAACFNSTFPKWEKQEFPAPEMVGEKKMHKTIKY